MVFVTSYRAAEVLQPADRALDLPATADSTQLAIVLGSRLHSTLAVPANHLDSTLGKTSAQGIAVRCEVIKQTLRPATDDTHREQWFDQGNFMRTGTRDMNADRQAVSFAEHHDL